VEIISSEGAKVVSIAQDLIYAQSKGRTQTQKSLALGMAYLFIYLFNEFIEQSTYVLYQVQR
jgi:hypothetical protein